MINLNNTTKRAQGFIQSYLNAKAVTMRALYNKPSSAKWEAEKRIYGRMASVNGKAYNYRAWGATSFCFTAGYMLESPSGNHYLIVETASNTYKIDVEGIID